MIDLEALLMFRKPIFAVSQVKFAKGGKTKEPDSATGFFFGFEGQLYFITNRHNVIDENDWFYPDELRLKLHIDENDFTKNQMFPIPLYDPEHRPLWLEHPKGKDIDVVALTVDLPSSFFIMSFNKENLWREGDYVLIGNDLIVAGYPLGLYDSKHNTPIIRNAAMASVYPLPFEGKDYFLIDSRLHEGTSGSPVISKPQNKLVGIHSGQLEEDTNLNIVWYAELIIEIICGKKIGSIM
jgi:hypothetical protein